MSQGHEQISPASAFTVGMREPLTGLADEIKRLVGELSDSDWKYDQRVAIYEVIDRLAALAPLPQPAEPEPEWSELSPVQSFMAGMKGPAALAAECQKLARKLRWMADQRAVTTVQLDEAYDELLSALARCLRQEPAKR